MKQRYVPRGTCQKPPLVMVKMVSHTCTTTLPECTKNIMCILREFLSRLKPSGGISTMPQPKKGVVSVLANLKLPSPLSCISILLLAWAISVEGSG